MKVDRLYEELGRAIAEAPSIPPCMVSDPDAWLPNMAQGNSREIVNVRKLCQQCPVKMPCAEYAIANPDLQGIWGGLAPRERTRIRMRRRTT
jgi:WhiB family redox-sensing transcriptional regulator